MQELDDEKPSYSINLMWINKKLYPKQSYIYPTSYLSNIFPSYNPYSVYNKLLKPIFRWAELNPESTVNLWIDSLVTPLQAINNTKELIEKFKIKHQDTAPIQIKDLREVPKICEHPEVFSEKTSVYLRADLCRLIASIYSLSEDPIPFVYADLDVTPLDKEQLFDEKTEGKLRKYGMVINENRVSKDSYENQFHIITAENSNLIEAIEHVLIDLNIRRIQNVLDENYRGLFSTQMVYGTYVDMFRYWYHLNGYGELHVVPNLENKKGDYFIFEDEVYDKDKHGFTPFGVTSNRNNLYFQKEGKFKLPIKKICAPISHFHKKKYMFSYV